MKFALAGRSIQQSILLFFIGIPLIGIAALGLLSHWESSLYLTRFRAKENYIFEQADKTLLATIRTILSKEAEAINRSSSVRQAAEATDVAARREAFQALVAKWPELHSIDYWNRSETGNWSGRRYPADIPISDHEPTVSLVQTTIGNGLMTLGRDGMLNLVNPVSSSHDPDGFVVLRFDASALEKALERAKSTVGAERESLEREFADSIVETAFWQWGSAAALLLLLLFWAWYRARTFLAPLRELEENAGEIAAGNWSDLSFHHRHRTDFRELVISFEWMRKRITRFMNELEQRSAERAALRKTLTLGRRIQERLLPDKAPEMEKMTCSGWLLSARETSGDFYYWRKTDGGKLFIAIGDVSGKGLPAALFMVRIQTLLEHSARRIDDPGEVLLLLNNELAKRNPSNMFSSMQCILCDAEKGEVLLANGGHLKPRVIDRAGMVLEIEVNKTMVAGVFEISEGNPYQSVRLPWNEGDTWLFYTDGVTEAVDAAGRQFGSERLTETCSGVVGSPQELIAKIEQARRAFVGGALQSDDVTMVAVTRLADDGEEL